MLECIYFSILCNTFLITTLSINVYTYIQMEANTFSKIFPIKNVSFVGLQVSSELFLN